MKPKEATPGIKYVEYSSFTVPLRLSLLLSLLDFLFHRFSSDHGTVIYLVNRRSKRAGNKQQREREKKCAHIVHTEPTSIYLSPNTTGSVA